MGHRLARGAAFFGATFCVAGLGRAQVPLRDLQEFIAASGSRRAFWGSSWDLRGPLEAPLRPPLGKARWVPAGRYAVLRAATAEPAALLARLPNARWTPPRHLLLDRARVSLHLEPAFEAGAGRGQGVVIGVVDAGLDITHPDLQNGDGSTRVAWWIDFASDPAGRHPELESSLGCEPEAGLRCQILDAADLDERLENGVAGDEPSDPLGHGTHVASIAAGNGRSRADGAFRGVAPEATLIAARVVGASGGIADSDVVLATRFVFERAEELGMPAVVNLSLGSDFGAHDGSSELSRVLASFVGPEHPGRAIVVAGGNSGAVWLRAPGELSDPLGIHTEVQVDAGSARRVPLLTPYPESGAQETDASLFVWLNLFPATDLAIGLELPDGARLEAVGLGERRIASSGGVTAAVIHGLGTAPAAPELESALPGLELGDLLPSQDAAVILIDGRWAAGGTFGIELTGQGRAELWVQSEGDLGPEASRVGAVFPHATAQQTIMIPASDPALMAVGASINRLDWTDFGGAPIRVAEATGEVSSVVGAAASFSSAGPNRLGDIKPDLLAPGGFVVGALAAAADPSKGGRGVFSGLCVPLGCQILSPQYAVTAGTSMAAPMVSGAAALLLEHNPALTQGEIQALLQAGSNPVAPAPEPGSREGGGVMDIARSFEALSAPERDVAEVASASESRLRFAGEYLTPDPGRSLAAQLWLRDGEGAVFDAAVERVSAIVSGGALVSGVERLAPGLYRLRVAASGRGRYARLRVEVQLDERPFLSAELPIAGVSEPPRTSLAGGCGLASEIAPPGNGPPRGPGAWLGAALLAFGWAGRRRLRSPRDTR